MKEKKFGWIVNLSDFKMVDWIINAKNAKKSYAKLTNESIKNFPALYKFCNDDLDKFFLLLRKGIYPYEYMDSWEKFNENTIPPIEAFYRELDLEGISDADYEHVKKVWEAFKIKNIGEDHDVCSMRYIACSCIWKL